MHLSHDQDCWHLLADCNGLCLTRGHIVHGQPAKAQASMIPPHLQHGKAIQALGQRPKLSSWNGGSTSAVSTLLHTYLEKCMAACVGQRSPVLGASLARRIALGECTKGSLCRSAERLAGDAFYTGAPACNQLIAHKSDLPRTWLHGP